MSVDYKHSAVYDVRGYMAQELFAAMVLNQQDYYIQGLSQPINPIIPIQDLPEFSGEISGKPHIIYDIVTDTDDNTWWIYRDEATFVLRSDKFSKNLEFIEFVKDKFGQADLSAAGVNLYAISKGSPFRFFNFHILQASSTLPTESEGGKSSAPVVLGYSYKRVAS